MLFPPRFLVLGNEKWERQFYQFFFDFPFFFCTFLRIFLKLYLVWRCV